MFSCFFCVFTYFYWSHLWHKTACKIGLLVRNPTFVVDFQSILMKLRLRFVRLCYASKFNSALFYFVPVLPPPHPRNV